MTSKLRKLTSSVALALALVLGAGEAAAVVGMPLTPVSVAGVARRTTRRAAYAGGATYGAYGAYGAAGTTISTLPAGCVDVVQAGVVYQKCGTTLYQPYYQGTNVVYVVSPP